MATFRRSGSSSGASSDSSSGPLGSVVREAVPAYDAAFDAARGLDTVQDLDSAEPAPCAECGGRGFRTVDGDRSRVVPCECRLEARGREFLAQVGVPARYTSCSLGSFKTSDPDPRTARRLQLAKSTAERYVDGFLDSGRPNPAGLLFMGPPGTGKTHLAVSVLVEIVRRYRVRGKFINFTWLLHRMRSTFDGGAAETRLSIFEPVLEAEILVFDELGAQHATPWVRDTLYLIVNSRYEAKLPTLFTSNYWLEDERPAPRAPKPRVGGIRGSSASGQVDGDPPTSPALRGSSEHLLSSRLSAPLVSRLYEMTVPLQLGGTDYRTTVKKPGFRLGV